MLPKNPLNKTGISKKTQMTTELLVHAHQRHSTILDVLKAIKAAAQSKYDSTDSRMFLESLIGRTKIEANIQNVDKSNMFLSPLESS